MVLPVEYKKDNFKKALRARWSQKMAKFPENLSAMKGFLSTDEGETLYKTAEMASKLGPILEIGSYCGKSTIYLALGCRENNKIVFTIDHHKGSEEHQVGESFHDSDLVSPQTGEIDSFAEFRKNISSAGVEDNIVPIVAKSTVVANVWQIPLAMVFIDGGHSLQAALTDYRSWSKFLLRGGFLAIHDVFEAPEKGGQAPRAVHDLAINSGLFLPHMEVDSLRVLQRL